MVGSVTEATSYQEWIAMGGEDNQRNVSGDMGKDQFLQLLVAQLKNQDPMQPSDNNEFVAQLAQFSSLESMQNMTKSLESMSQYQSYSLIGQYVTASAYVDGAMTDIEGIVDSIFTRSGVSYAMIGEYAVPVSSITQVCDTEFLTPNQSLLETANQLVGRQVKANSSVTVKIEETGEDGEITVREESQAIVVKGVVTRVAAEDGVMYAYVDDGSGEEKRVAVGEIFDIGQTVAAAEKKDETKLEDEEIPEQPGNSAGGDDNTVIDNGSGSGTIITGGDETGETGGTDTETGDGETGGTGETGSTVIDNGSGSGTIIVGGDDTGDTGETGGTVIDNGSGSGTIITGGGETGETE